MFRMFQPWVQELADGLAASILRGFLDLLLAIVILVAWIGTLFVDDWVRNDRGYEPRGDPEVEELATPPPEPPDKVSAALAIGSAAYLDWENMERNLPLLL